MGEYSLTTNVYIDGLNLYYCAVSGTQYKWLNVLALCQNLFPGKTFKKISYCSAKVKAYQHDPGAPTRQEIYWRALRTIPDLEIIESNFVRWPRLMPQFPLAYINGNMSKPPQKVQVERTDEKGSDVNLAAYLVYDNCIKEADESIVISNDSDLRHAVEIVTNKLKRAVIVVNPNRTKMARHPSGKMSGALRKVASQCVLSVNESVLANSQFPATITDSHGTFHKPPGW